VAYRTPGGATVTARRETGGWVPDTLLASGNAWFTLAVDPITDATVVAYRDSTRLRIARRQPGGWTVSTVDSGIIHGQLSLALDPAGRPRIAIGRGPAGEYGVFYAEAESDAGPWTWTLVDAPPSWAVDLPSLALDPVTSEPRVAYVYVPLQETWAVGYASRTGGVWTPESYPWLVSSSLPFVAPSVSVDDAGTVRIVASVSRAQSSGRPVLVLERANAAIPGPFQQTDLTTELGGQSSSLAAAVQGRLLHVAWRNRADASLMPNAVIHTTFAVPTAVPPSTPRPPALSASPNPVRPGSELTVSLQIERTLPVTLDLLDIAGRRVASHGATPGTGAAALRWMLPPLRAGWYQIRARQAETVLGSAPLLIVD
jgi:hypothetical protein